MVTVNITLIIMSLDNVTEFKLEVHFSVIIEHYSCKSSTCKYTLLLAGRAILPVRDMDVMLRTYITLHKTFIYHL